jgi:hypothetical protein
MHEGISRREVLARGVVVLGALAPFAAPAAARAAKRRSSKVVYRLRATSRCTCVACQRHAVNKLFATRAAADRGRAHPGCQCEVVRGARLPRSQWNRLFGASSRLKYASVDRRSARTRRILRPSRYATAGVS